MISSALIRVGRRCSHRALNIASLVLLVTSFHLSDASAEPIRVYEKQGSMHGFLVLKSTQGKVIAVGDQVNVVERNEVRSRLRFDFRDGSIDDEACVFEQGAVFRLISDHHIQKGPSFPQPLDLALNVPTGKVTWRQANGGNDEVKTERMDLPPDLSNGLTSLIVENFPQNAAEMKVPYLAVSSKPRVVNLSVRPIDKDTFYLAGVRRRSKRFNVHVEIGGLAGMVAPLIGKQPSDITMWVSDDEVPVFLRMKGALYEKGPIWTMELASPVWSETEK